jgi:predicted dehydrogenase
MPPAPVLLVGCGRWGRNILRDLVSLGRPAIVVDPSAEARQAAAPIARATHADLDVDEDVCCVIVATPATRHSGVIERAARWQRPIFVEKPLATRIEDAERALELAGDRLFVMDKWRYHPGVEALGALARSGELGAVRAVRTWRLGRNYAHEDVDPIWTLLPHDLSILREILGYLPSAVSAVAERADGRVSGIAANLGGDPRCTVEASGHRSEHRRRIEVAFGDAVAVLDGERDTVVEIRSGGDRRTIDVPGHPPLERELDAFLGYLDGGTPPKSSGSDGVESVRRITELRRLAGLDD